MLRIYNTDKQFVGYVTDYEDDAIERDLESGDASLSFTYLGNPADIQNEYYIVTDTDEFVVKESNAADRSYVCKLNLEDLEASQFRTFSAPNASCKKMAALALAGTGWTVETDIDSEKIRSVQTFKATPYTILAKIRDAFMCDMWFDTLNKVVHFQEKMGEDKGVYFLRGLNLTKSDVNVDTYDYYTRIIPYGKDDLTIESVNNGLLYLENYQYSKKVRTYIWEDTSYEDAQALMDDARGKLEDLSKPKKSYTVSVINLANAYDGGYVREPAALTDADSGILTDESGNILTVKAYVKKTGEYRLFSYGLGDTVTIIDKITGIRDKQRIVKIKAHPHDPTQDEIELSNTVLTWEEMQSRLKTASDAWEDSTNADGTIKGVRVYGVSVDGVVGVETAISSNSTIQNIKSDVSSLETSVAYLATEVETGTVTTTYLKATDATLTSANIDTATIANGTITSITATYGNINDLVAANAKVTDTVEAVTANTDLVNTGTIVAKRIVFENDDGTRYELTGTDGTLTKIELTDGEYQDALNGSTITAKSVTATEAAFDSLTVTGTLTGTTVTATDGTFSGKVSGAGGKAWVGQNSDGTEHGLYSETLGKWITYADSSGIYLNGKALTADALTVSAGSTDLPVYFADGKPVAIASYSGKSATAGAADTAEKATYVRDSTNGNNISVTYAKAGQSSTSWLASWNGYELGAISPMNIAAGSARTLGGYQILGANGSAKWYHLGNLVSGGDSTETIIEVFSGSGYNGASNQNTSFRIFIKDGWQSSKSASTAFGVSVSYGRPNATSEIKVSVRASADNACQVWAYLPWGYYNGFYTVSGVFTSWTDGNHESSDNEPTAGIAQYVSYETLNAGSSTTPIYFNNGAPVAITSYSGKAATAGNADTVGGKIFNWTGKGGQPTWLWGGEDGVNMYVYNPSNFSVNYAASANYATSAGNATKWNGITDQHGTENTTDTWVPVYKDNVIQHRLIPTCYNSTSPALDNVTVSGEFIASGYNGIRIGGRCMIRCDNNNYLYFLPTSSSTPGDNWTAVHMYYDLANNKLNGAYINCQIVNCIGLYGHAIICNTPEMDASGNNRRIDRMQTNGGTMLSVRAQWSNSSSYSWESFAHSGSDIRLKTNVQDVEIDDALTVINKIKLHSFDWKSSGEHQKIGFIADELEKIDQKLAEGGGYDQDGTPIWKSVNMFYLQGYEVRAIQELSGKVRELENIVMKMTA